MYRPTGRRMASSDHSANVKAIIVYTRVSGRF